jgi:tetratricopeptide (TPR) repeat protein
LQALDIAWDSRAREQGGQRWIHLHPEEPIRHDDVLHWTGPNLNWNYMCADCHSTNLKKHYHAESDSYRTEWAEIDVSCEACHGPGSAHLRWAASHADGESSDLPDMGLSVRFTERAGVSWRHNEKTGKIERSVPRQTDKEIQVCARCHSRRSQLGDDLVASGAFLDSYRPALLTEGLYHADGQIEDEVYVWGSFLQSRMYQAGMTCSDCHDPHSADLRLPGDQVCHQCHQADRYAARTHHFHPVTSDGASCVECHMPATTYMVVDPRHDHSFRVPRPAQSIAQGTPNACNRCHRDRSAQWAAQQVEAWYGRQPEGLQRYAPALHAARRGLPEARALLQELVGHSSQPPIARATALSSLGAYPDRRSLELIRQGLNAREPLLRLGALNGLESLELRQRMPALPLLWDEVRAVRIEAARLLAPLAAVSLPEAQRAKLDHAIQEYIAVQRFNAERPEAQVNLAGIYTDLGRYQEAELAYRKALRLQPRFVPAYVNMAQLLSVRNRELEATGLLRHGLETNPRNAVLQHALGLSLVRQNKHGEAMAWLAAAAESAPGVPRYSYVYAVALQSSGKPNQALQVLEAAHRRHRGHAEILYALTTFNRDEGHREDALRYARKLNALLPDVPAVEQLVEELDKPGHGRTGEEN